MPKDAPIRFKGYRVESSKKSESGRREKRGSETHLAATFSASLGCELPMSSHELACGWFLGRNLAHPSRA